MLMLIAIELAAPPLVMLSGTAVEPPPSLCVTIVSPLVTAAASPKVRAVFRSRPCARLRIPENRRLRLRGKREALAETVAQGLGARQK